jgi:putative metalloprotease
MFHFKRILLSAITCSILLTGCENIDSALATTAALEGVQAATLSDEDLRSVSRQAANKMDTTNNLAPSTSPYAKRLQRLIANYQVIDGVQFNYAVYLSDSVNAFAMADGTVRVYSKLMDILTDDELLFVIGHEVGHVMLQHSKRSTQLAMSTSAIRKGTAAVGGTIGQIAQSELTTLAQNIVQAQFSQKEEKSADDYGYVFMTKNGYNKNASVSALRKLGNEGGGLLSSHPNPQDRADRLERR